MFRNVLSHAAMAIRPEVLTLRDNWLGRREARMPARGLGGIKAPARHPLHDDFCSARAFAVNPRACGATLRASGVDCSARPSKEGYHAMNADTCLVLLTPDQFG